jgi:2-polyprenyl-6-methoxyphenol hydroxylase-like FAD-dependent oxidoreductase
MLSQCRGTDLHRVLLAAVHDCEAIATRFGETVVAATPAGRVRVASADARRDDLGADVVVGADGVNSRVRTTGGFRVRVSPGTRYLRSIVDRQVSEDFEEHWTRLGSFGHAPAGPGRTYFWVAAATGAGAVAVDHRDLPALTAAWGEVVPLPGELLSAVTMFDELLINTVRRVDCRRWYSGRLALIGDAAHAMAPNLGQGANSAMVDGAVLADRLADAGSAPEALAAYDEARRPFVRRIQDGSGLLQRMCGLRSPLAARVRDAVMTASARRPDAVSRRARPALAHDVDAVRGGRPDR